MQRRQWRLWFGIGLIALSAVLFVVHYAVFRDLHHLGIFTLHDIAFLPLEVLIVTLIIHEMLTRHERRELMQKLNMVIDAFFSEAGTDLLERVVAFDTRPHDLHERFRITEEWSDKQLKAAALAAKNQKRALTPSRADVAEMRDFLGSKRDFLLRLLENPTLLENDRFTELLWAVFHLGDELHRRKDVLRVSEFDFNHLVGDIERAYTLLICEHLEHLRHLRSKYPYLYSLALRTNPLAPDAAVEVDAA